MPILYNDCGNRYISDKEKADALALYFASVFNDTDNPANSVLEEINTQDALTEFYFYPDDVSLVLKNLRPSATEPYDGIPQIIYKKCYLALCKPLAHLFNLSLFTNEVPHAWKHSICKSYTKVIGE